ncbi:MAG: magnesium/cobalt transporter CorA [Spirochaetaceae bacterium]|jgi:magnesium transporter|nr:magnesium/cobalt transporter CorA [Spirochaetaceae bacterium]
MLKGMELAIIGYDPVGAWLKTADTLEELLTYRNTGGLTWIQVRDARDADRLAPLVEFFGIHPLTVEDILDTEQRPKVEEFDHYLFIAFKEAALPEASAPDFRQISLILTKDTVITFQQGSGMSFDGIRRRILNNIGRTRRMGADYLAYLIMDTAADTYFLALDAIGGNLEEYEDRALDENDDALMPDLQRIKRTLLKIRRIIWPIRESLTALMPADSNLINPELEPFFKDLHDNVMQVLETIESYREALSGVMEVHLAALSARMNNVMKVLTIISTIFIPLTFIAGVYGMNFAFMPELQWHYAYPVIWGVMILIAIGMLLFFKRRRWI